MWLGAPRHGSRDGIEPDLQGAVQRRFVHLVKRSIHQAGEISLDEQTSAGENAHQAADRAEFAERYQRPEVAISEGLDRLPGQSARNLFQQMRGLLMRRLGARRNRPRLALL